VEFLVQWDDEQVPRAHNLALFEALASAEKTLHANPGKHGVPAFDLDSRLRSSPGTSAETAACSPRRAHRDLFPTGAPARTGRAWPRVQAGPSAPARGRRQGRMLPDAALVLKQALSDPVNVS
jgi:hypothetical protein